ncbi:hypothetical protein B7486_57810, partial [cyanobacterium TDX16]
MAALVLCSVLLGIAACGGAGEDAEPDSGGSGAATSTQEPPTIAFVGDSVMDELAEGLVAALEGQAEVSFIGQSSVAGNLLVPLEWSSRLGTEDPDLVVVLVGTWEAIAAEYHPGEQAYLDEVAPFLDVVAERAEVLWLGHPRLQHEAEVTTDDLNSYWSQLPERHPGVTFLDAGAALEEDGEFRTLLDVDGRQVLVRQIDGRHLCPDGVVLMGRAVLEELERRFGLQPADGWEQGDWRDLGDEERGRLCPAGLGE